jgi:nucleotide-binding universal stress UspA family protein
MAKPLIANIVVAVSGTNASVHAEKYAIVMAKQLKCHLSAVYVVDTDTINELYAAKILIKEEVDDYERCLEASGERYLAFADELAAAKGLKIEKELRKGAVLTEILQFAAERKADIIVLGACDKDHSSSSMLSRLHGEISVRSSCSVLVAKDTGIDLKYKQL